MPKTSVPNIGGPIAQGTTGSVLFVGPGSVFAQDNSNFFWDDTNNRLGINITPTQPFHVSINNTTNNTFNTAAQFEHNLTSGTPAAGMGVALRFHLPSDTTIGQSAGLINFAWADPTHATRRTRCVMSVAGSGGIVTATEFFRGEYDGTQTVDSIGGVVLSVTRLAVYCGAAGYKGIAIRLASSPTANSFEVQTSTGTVLTQIDSTGSILARPLDAGTTNQTNTLIVDHDTTGTPAAGFGVQIRMRASNNGQTGRQMADFNTQWVDATDATRKARLTLFVYDTTNREIFRSEGDGTEAITAFGNGAVTAAVRVTIHQRTSTYVPQLIKLASGSSVDSIQIQDSSSVNIFTVDQTGAVMARPSDAVTAAVTRALTLGHRSSGTPAAGFGVDARFQGESSTTNDRDMGGIQATWTTATDASRNSQLDLYVYNVGTQRIGFSLIGSATGATITLGIDNQGLRINNQTSGAGVAAGTLLNAPTAGDPAFWLPINIAGTVRYIPCW